MKTPLPWQPGDTARLKKPHACGSTDWLVQRMGMDVRLQCLVCGKQLLLKRLNFEKMVHSRLPASNENTKIELF